MVCYCSIIKGNIYVNSKGYIEWYTRLEKWYETKMYSKHGWYMMNGYGMRYEINMYSNHGMVRGGWLWYAVGNGKNEV